MYVKKTKKRETERETHDLENESRVKVVGAAFTNLTCRRWMHTRVTKFP